MLLGVAFGAATSWLLDNIFRDPTLTTVVTLISAYASYYTADRLVGASGLLCVVCNGFAMSLMGEGLAAAGWVFWFLQGGQRGQ
jgi:NhaP-type Na+/H+ or K+/H+ antiporter